MSTTPIVILLGGFILLLAVPFYGQTLGEIVGEVKDSSGAVIPGATLSASSFLPRASSKARGHWAKGRW